MNKELFASMREQMRPSEAARTALGERLAAAKKKTVPVGRYAAIAACLAAAVAAVPVYRMVRDEMRWRALLDNFHQNACLVYVDAPHSYVLADSSACWPENSLATGNSADTGSGDRDQDMTPGELTDHMLEAGFTQGDVDGYLASGWQMTWAKWWKFYHQSEETGDRTLEALLAFSRSEGLTVNTGEADMPGGAVISGPDQSEAIMAYQNLMDRFKAEYGPDTYPEWYGGAYIDEHAGLIVNIVASQEPADKELFFQIQDWASSGRVGFGSSRYSLGHLRILQDAAFQAMSELGIAASCGINEELGRVELTLSTVTEDALWQLARMDPEGDALLVIVAQAPAADAPAEEPALTAPSVDHIIQPGGSLDPDTPVTYMPGVGEIVDPDWRPPEGDGPWQTEPREGGTNLSTPASPPASDMPGMIVDGDGVIAYEPQG